MQMQHEDMLADDGISDGEYNQLNLNSIISQQQQLNPNNSQLGSTPNGGQNLEYECTACEKKFKYFCYYKRHMDACHSEWPKYVCETCNKSYKWEASFRQHLRSHHVTLAGQYGAMDSGITPTQAELAAAGLNLNQNGDECCDEEEYIDDTNGHKIDDKNEKIDTDDTEHNNDDNNSI